MKDKFKKFILIIKKTIKKIGNVSFRKNNGKRSFSINKKIKEGRKVSVVMQEIERRKEAIDSYDAKVEKSARLKAEAEQLDKEIAETDIGKIQAEIYELTEDAIKLGYIEVEEVVEEVDDETNEAIDTAERAASVFTQSD